jgi:lysine 2,3-aminomutase
LFNSKFLLKGINDDKDTLEELFMRLYEQGIKPYYLIHCFPGIQGASQFRTSVRKGVELMNSLKRRISNIAM